MAKPVAKPKPLGQSPPTPAHPLSTRELLAGAGLILLCSLLVYFPALRGGFIFDDDLLLTNNDLIKAADGLYRFWFTTQPYDYWPVSNTMLWFEWRLFGLHPAGYHLANLLLHIGSAGLLWTILRRLAIPGALVAALLFAVHPVNVESVAWIAQRKSLLATFFSLLSVHLYLKTEVAPGAARAHPPAGSHWYALSLLVFLLAMLSKVSAAVLPPLLLAILWWMRPLSRRDVARLMPYFLIVAALLPVNLWFRGHGLPTPASSAAPVDRLLGAAGVIWFYLFKALIPINLCFMYPEWQVHADQPLFWGAYFAAVAVTGVLWWYRQTWGQPILFAWLFFCVALLPVLGFTDVGFGQHIVVADHYQYVGLMGVCALVAAVWGRWQESQPATSRRLPNAVAAALIGGLAIVGWQQSSLYADAATLYLDTLQRNPDAWAAHNNLGDLLAAAGQSTEAIEHFEQALRAKPDHVEAHNNLGTELLKVGRLQEAITHFQKALEYEPRFFEGHYNLGVALGNAGQLQGAIDHYQEAVRLKPDLPEGHNSLCLTLTQAGRLPDAIEHCRRAVQLKPDFIGAHYNLGNALFRSGKIADAVGEYEQVLRLAPGNAEAHNNLGTALGQLGKLEEAIGHYQEALRLNPEFTDAKSNLAVALTMQQKASATP